VGCGQTTKNYSSALTLELGRAVAVLLALATGGVRLAVVGCYTHIEYNAVG